MPHLDIWKNARASEFSSIINNGVGTPKINTANKKLLETQNIYKCVFDGSGFVEKFKCRCVLRGDKCQEGVDYHPDEIFAPVCRRETVNLGIADACQRGRKIYHLD